MSLAQVTRTQPVAKAQRPKRAQLKRQQPELKTTRAELACGHTRTIGYRFQEELESELAYWSERLCTQCADKNPAELRRQKRSVNLILLQDGGEVRCEEPFCSGRVSQAEARHSQRVNGGAILCADCAAADVREAA